MTPAPTADRRSPPLAPYDALVLAGGQARRLGGVDKMAIPLGGRDLLDRVLDAVPDADRVVVVGPPRPLPPPVAWRREDPPGGGPVAAIAAGLPATSAPLVAVLAGDLPFLTASAVGALRAAVGPDDDGALLVDADGRAQLLAGVWRSAALRPALARFPEVAGVSVHLLLEPLRARHLATGPAALAAPPWWDCDTADDVERAKGWL